MPAFCPKCGNMVPDGAERCGACGARLTPRIMDKTTGFTWADFFNYSLVPLLFMLAAIVFPVLLGLFCFYLYAR